MRSRSRVSVLALVASLVLSGCTSTTVKRTVSPLIGSWRLNGSLPGPAPDLPRFVDLTFERDGKLDATYVVATGVLATVVHAAPQVRSEHDTYSLLGDRTLRIVEGSRQLDYTYEVVDGKLSLTPPGGGDAIVYRRI